MIKIPEADVFIQWKGTDVCLDFHCFNCNTFGHFDGDFCYMLKCPNCNQRYQLPSTFALKPVYASKYHDDKIPNDCSQDLNEYGWKMAVPIGTCTYMEEQ